MVIIRRQEEAGFKPLPDDIIAFRALGYTKHLVAMGIAGKDFERVYEMAIQIYNQNPNVGPFGIDHLIQAGKNFLRVKKGPVIYERPKKNSLVSCTTCQGTKMVFLLDGKTKSILRNADGSIKKCEDCR